MVTSKINKFELCNVAAMRGNKLLFEDINCTLKQGDLLAIKGSNGTGKTTLLKVISGIIQPSKGKITINNEKIDSNNIGNITYLDSTPVFKNTMNVVDYLVYWTTIYTGVRDISYKQVQYAIDFVGLTTLQNNTISTLSLGQKKRLLLCKLLLVNRQLWLLDEPTIGLDIFWCERLVELITNQRTKGGIIIFTTHMELVLKDLLLLHL